MVWSIKGWMISLSNSRLIHVGEIKLIDRMSEQNQFILAFIIQTFCFSVFLTRFLSTQLSQTCDRKEFLCWIPIRINLSQEYLITVNSFVIIIPTRRLCLYSYQMEVKINQMVALLLLINFSVTSFVFYLWWLFWSNSRKMMSGNIYFWVITCKLSPLRH